MINDSNQGVLYIPYFVSEAEIARFLAKYLKARVSFLNVHEDNWGNKEQIRKEEGIEREFDDAQDFIITNGTINISYLGNQGEVSLFYRRANVETKEDVEFYKENKLPIHQKMTEIQSLAKREEGIKILHILHDEYGGYLTENLLEKKFSQKDLRKALTTDPVFVNERVDIMVNYNRMGNTLDAPLMQISAAQFDIETGKILRKYQAFSNIKSLEHADVHCVREWIRNNPELISDAFDADNDAECSVISTFRSWIDDINRHAERVNIWLNDAREYEFILKKIYMQNLNVNPFNPENIRDVRTVLDLAAIKDGLFDPVKEYENGMKEDKYQFAEQQTKANVETLCKAYRILMPRGSV